MRKRYFYTRDEPDRISLRKLESEYKVILPVTHESCLLGIQTNDQQNSVHFWDFVEQRKACNDIPTSVKYDIIAAHSDLEAADLLVTYFESAFSKASPVQRLSTIYHSYSFLHLKFRKLLKITILRKAPEQKVYLFLKNCAATLATSISIVNRSLQNIKFPIAWKTASVVSIQKSGSYNRVRFLMSTRVFEVSQYLRVVKILL